MNHAHDKTTAIAAYLFIAIFALTEVGLFLFHPHEDNIDMLKEMVSTLRDAILFLVGFLFGSSMGSRLKDKPAIDPTGGPVRTSQTETTTVQTEVHQDVKPQETL